MDRTPSGLLGRYPAEKPPGKAPLEPIPSSHLFEADLPDDLKPGAYTPTGLRQTSSAASTTPIE